RNTDFHILLDLHLARKSYFPLLFGTAQVANFCRKNFSSSFFHYASAFSTSTAPTACGRKENLLGAQGAHQSGSSRNNQWFVLVAINDDLDVSRGYQFGLGE